ncbi:hypothetical protein DE146DRAFT_645631 [Phaeosphaeria sp. MPI-PUGE-AT-0046c]|nr:hypothetical protein DE146DRAFT_645631 [Phaeosphaeria sp. MPI-PUGE-AT-0046c]
MLRRESYAPRLNGFSSSESLLDTDGGASPPSIHRGSEDIEPHRTRTGSSGRRPSLFSQMTPAQFHTWSSSNGSSRRQLPHGISDDNLRKAPTPIVPTTKCLQNFPDVVARTARRTIPASTIKAREHHRQQHDVHKETLMKLRAWDESRTLKKQHPIQYWWKTHVEFSNKPPSKPSEEELVNMVYHYYPLRADIKIHVCDFGRGKYEKKDMKVSELKEDMCKKPEWSQVRWIHMPFGIGLVHSSMEELFLKGKRDIPGEPNVSWPYRSIETLSIYNHEELKDMQDVYRIMSRLASVDPDIKNVIDRLNRNCLSNLPDDLKEDIEWRALHNGIKEITHWTLALPDFHRPLEYAGVEMVDPEITAHTTSLLQPQMISQCKTYEKAHLVKSSLRCFHRADGFLLTMCPDGGVDYVDRHINEYLNQPRMSSLMNESSSALGLLFHLFDDESEAGTSSWHVQSVEWLLLYIITEMAAKPNNIRQGGNAPSLSKAYQIVVAQLKQKRYAKFERNESVAVVRQYLACIDELAMMTTVLQRNSRELEDLIRQAESVRRTFKVVGGNMYGESAESRITWAKAQAQTGASTSAELLGDLRASMTALFQLRSIEQNELAIVADNQNKAILVFTGVTVVFLPLSFFTSYFGMNLDGLANTTRTEKYFWKVCGTTGFVIVLALVLYVQRIRIARRLRHAVSSTLV